MIAHNAFSWLSALLLLLSAAVGTPTPTPTPRPTATPLGLTVRYGEVVNGTLNTLQPESYFLFEGRGGDVILITMERADGVIDPLVMLIDTNLQNVLAVDNDGGGDRSARLRYVLPVNGRYVIKATAAQRADLNGGFRLSILLLNPTPTPSLGGLVPRLSRLKSGAIRADLDTQITFRAHLFALKAGDAFTATLQTDGDLQVGLYLYAPDTMQELARAELGGAIRFTASADQAYVLVVSRLNGMGGYTLSADLPDRAAALLPGPRLIPGQQQTGEIGQRIGALYTFGSLSGTRFDLTLSRTDLVALLAGPGWDEIAVSAGGAIRDALLQTEGSYTLLIMPVGGVNAPQPGSFALTFQGAIDPDAVPTVTRAAPVSATPGRVVTATFAPTVFFTVTPTPGMTALTYGVSASGALTPENPRAFFRFRGAEGDRVLIQMNRVTNEPLDPILYLYFYGQTPPLLVAGGDDRTNTDPDAAITDFRLPRSGEYVIIAAGKNATLGRFTLSLSRRG